ncbi:MAG: carbohydrate binding domain-containing protein, partial [Bacteroidaceae bacterium]|nr:carbohydrate binding domain-containing protein [Bacteroidaceae bacterium]
MKRNYFIFSFLALSMWMQGNVWGAERFSSDDDSGPKIEALINLTSEGSTSGSGSTMYIKGTNSFESLTVNGANLKQDISITATSGLQVSPTVIAAGSGSTEVKVTLTSTMAETNGQIILRSGDVRTYVKVVGYGTPLEKKDLSQNPVYAGGDDEEMTFDGFSPTEKGYTLEFKAKTDNANKKFYPYAVSKEAVGFKGYVTSEGLGLYNSTTQKALSNPSNGGTFYNTDGLYHTYRYSVTSDKRIFVYRDGLAIDTLRLSELALQPEFAIENDDYVENLLKNADFEGEYNIRPSDQLTYRIDGWDVSPLDQYNSTQEIVTSEVDNTKDLNNHALAVHRYMWADGWGAAEISQIVDVAPNETYSFSALAKGGIKSDGTVYGSLRVYDLQDSNNTTIVPVTSDSYQTYAADFTTSAQCKQIRVVCYLERGAGWGASVSALTVDDVKLMGMKRSYDQKIGFTNEFSDVAYFNFDATGAYAPLNSAITSSSDSLKVDGTGNSGTFTIKAENLINDITLTATSGLSVSPATIAAGTTDAEVKVTLTSTMAETNGQIILRSGDVRTYVKVVGYGTPLEKKDLSQNPVYAGGDDEEMTFDGFSPTEKGYTLEF